MLDVLLFRSPAFSGGCVAVVLSYAMLYAMFFVMSFALVRGYHDAPLAAGLRLAIVPVALGIVAPLAGGLSDAHPRLMPVVGMAICAAALAALGRAITGAPDSLPLVMAALAAYGAGLGTFIAPNNTATMGAAPPERSGQAGGLLNLLRVVGTGLGVASASAVLSWRIGPAGGGAARTVGVPEPVLLAAVDDALVLLGAFALVAGAASLLRSRRRPSRVA
jgi:MFS family permease